MRLCRFGPVGHERPGIVDDEGVRRDCSSVVEDWASPTLVALPELPPELPAVDPDARWGPCVARPGKIVCIGLNYEDHAAEAELALPAEPVFFLKATTALCGPYDDIVLPAGSEKVDWEAELAFVVGSDGAIVGYAAANDISERHLQLETNAGQWTKGKSCDSFFPLGPVLNTAIDPRSLAIALDVNGTRRQDSSTRAMVFDCRQIADYLARFMTLEPGDVVSTGTPAGVGFSRTPPVFLAEGDLVTLSIEGLGEQRQRCRWASSP